MLWGKLVNREALRDVALGPGSELWRGFLVSFDETIELILCGFGIACSEDGADVVGDLGPHVDLGGVMHRVLCQMKLATLPCHSREGSFPCCEEYLGTPTNRKPLHPA